MQPDSFDAANHLSRLYPTEDLAFLRQPGLDIIIFRPTNLFVNGGGKSCSMLRFFFTNSAKSPRDLHPFQLILNLVTLAQLAVRLPGRHEVVGSNPCRCVKFLAENIPVLISFRFPDLPLFGFSE